MGIIMQGLCQVMHFISSSGFSYSTAKENRFSPRINKSNFGTFFSCPGWDITNKN